MQLAPGAVHALLEIRLQANLKTFRMVADHSPLSQPLQVLKDFLKSSCSSPPERLIPTNPKDRRYHLLILGVRE